MWSITADHLHWENGLQETWSLFFLLPLDAFSLVSSKREYSGQVITLTYFQQHYKGPKVGEIFADALKKHILNSLTLKIWLVTLCALLCSIFSIRLFHYSNF